MIEFQSHIGSLDYLLGVNYIFIPSNIVQKLGGFKAGRLICKANNTIEFQCGIVSLGEGNGYITLNKTRLKKLKLQTGDSITIRLEKDNSEYGMELSDELKELLSQDHEANLRFNALKPGMQRYIIFYVSQVKSPHLRLERALLLLNNLKQIPTGKETFRAILGKE
ncbi:MAG: YdeI/OmpD-associated family protein [Bacteroidia bacterium]